MPVLALDLGGTKLAAAILTDRGRFMQHSLVALVLPDPEHSPATRGLLVLGYIAAALFWWQAAMRERQFNEGTPRTSDAATRGHPFARWWKLGASLLCFLAASKAVDLRAHCEIALRSFAKATGWWEHRQPVQFFLAIILPALGGLVFAFLALTRARQFARSHPLTVVGWLLVYLYLACRQSLEWKPALHGLVSIGYFDWRLLPELAGILLLCASAFRAGRQPQTAESGP